MDGVEMLYRQPADTLAAWVLALDAGSHCFCCGTRLRADDPEASSLLAEAHLLRCRRCGAEVSAPCSAEGPVTRMKTPQVRRPVPAAA